MHVCVPAPKAINYTLVILNLYNQLNKFVVFRKITKLSMHRRGLCNEARRDRNQPYKVDVVYAYHEVLAQAMNKHFSNNIMMFKTIVPLSYQSIKPF